MSGRPTSYFNQTLDALSSQAPKRVNDGQFVASLARYAGFPALSEIRRPRGQVAVTLPMFYPMLGAG